MKHLGEVWQELDFNGEKAGGITTIELDMGKRKVKLLSGAAVILYRFKNGEVEYLFQHRAKSIKGDPDKWDVSTGGHVNLNEKQVDAAIREAKEEICADLKKEKLEIAANFLMRNTYITLYFYDYTNERDYFRFDDEEVEEVKWVKYSELESFWPNLKQILAENKIFEYCLEEQNQRILGKYGNLQT